MKKCHLCPAIVSEDDDFTFELDGHQVCYNCKCKEVKRLEANSHPDTPINHKDNQKQHELGQEDEA